MTSAYPTTAERVVVLLRQSPGVAVTAASLCRGAQAGPDELTSAISQLRRCGWPVHDVAAGAYLLAEDANRLDESAVRARLKTRWLGRAYQFATSLGSTNSEAAIQAGRGAAHGTVVLADGQQEGRGRHGRKWASPPGVNLYFSLLLRPQWTVGDVPPVSLATSVAVAKALACFLPRAPTVKWPNDLLWEGRKLCGILSEMVTEGGRIQHLVVGIGLNVNQWDFDPWVQQVATSMRRVCGMSLCRAGVLVELLRQIESTLELLLLGEAERVLDEWRDLASWVGGPVSVRSGNRSIQGRAVGVTRRGALRVVDSAGREHEVLAGDVVLGATTDRFNASQ